MIKKAGMLLFVMGVVVILFNGCFSVGGTKQTEWKPVESVSRPPFIHTVKYPGETMRIISRWYTGDVNNWEALADANPNIEYEDMAPGTRIFIPETLLKKTEPLTEAFIDSVNQKPAPVVKKEKKKPVSQPKPQPKKDDDFDLIGPK